MTASRMLPYRLFALATTFLMAEGLHAQAADRPDPPTGKELKAAVAEFRSVYPKLEDSLKGEAAGELAEEIRELAVETDGHPAIRFVLFDQAISLAAAAGEPSLTLQAIDAATAVYNVNRSALIIDHVPSAIRNARSEEVRRSGVEILLDHGEKAVGQSRWVAAAVIFKAASQASRVMEDPMAREAVDKVVSELRRCSEDGLDGAAHLEIASYLVIARNDWDCALEHLARCSVEGLAEIAAKDASLVASDDSDKTFAVSIADGWWAVHEAADGDAAKRMSKERCLYWLETSLPQLEGWDLAKTHRRIDDLREASETAGPSVVKSTPHGRKRIKPNKELLRNPGCEEKDPNWASSSIPWWTVEAGSWRPRQKQKRGCPEPIGRWFFGPEGAFAEGRLSQLVDLRPYARGVDLGTYTVKFSGKTAAYRQSPGDQGQLQLELLDEDGDVLATYESEQLYSPDWVPLMASGALKKGTRAIRVSLIAIRVKGRGQQKNNGYFDDLSLRISRRR